MSNIVTDTLQAIEGGHTGCAKQLLEHGADPNMPDNESQTVRDHDCSLLTKHLQPLHWATPGDKEIANLLIQKGAALDAQDNVRLLVIQRN